MAWELHHFQLPSKQRNVIFLIAIALTILAGVILALIIDKNRVTVYQDAPPEGRPLVITEITLGALARPEQEHSDNPIIDQKFSYNQNEPLVLRVSTASNITEPIEISARLLTPQGGVVEIDPPSIRLRPGTSSFCCWRIDKPGKYTLQLFRPEGIITPIPLTIREVKASKQPPQIGL